ncbi:MAG: MFS transporter [SAR202 cluster bacterium]|nr:MFS transporter [SAR202 cluster bacterium]
MLPATDPSRTAAQRWRPRLTLGTAFWGNFVTTGVTNWGLQVFAVPMQDDTGRSRASIYSALTVRWLAGAVLGLLIGRWLDRRHGLRALFVLSGVFGALTTSALSLLQSSLQFTLLFGLAGGVATIGATQLATATLTAKWFVRGRGRAMGIASLGAAAAALVMSPLVTA